MSNTKKKILLVGGSGYLGSHLRNILSPSFHVFSTSRTPKENYIQLDFLNKETFENLKQESIYDYIIFLASTLKGLGTTELKEEYLNVDTIGFSNLLKYISENKLGNKFIYISSMTVYGIKNSVPVKETGVLEPLSTYGLSKLLAEKIFSFYCKSTNTNGTILRIPGIYGGNRTSGFIYNTALKCIKGETIEIDTSSLGYWETIHIDDLCNSITEFLQNYSWQNPIETFNLGYGVKTDILECAEFIKKKLNSTSEIISKGKKGYTDFYLDNSKIKQFVKITDGYIQSLEHYVKNINA